jgi:hypothetical protein
MRLFMLTLLVTVAVSVPIANEIDLKAVTNYGTQPPTVERLSESDGQVFKVAGQDTPDEPLGGLVLTAQETCKVGELVRLDASQSDVDGLTWQILPGTSDFEVIEDGRRAFFSARADGPREFLVILAGARGGTPFLQHHKLTVEGIEAIEPDDPTPASLGQKIRGWLDKVEDYEGKASKALAMAEAFRSLADKEDLDVNDILEATAVANSAILGDDLDKWVPFLDDLGAELDLYIEEHALDTREQYREIWLRIAAGIEKATPAED